MITWNDTQLQIQLTTIKDGMDRVAFQATKDMADTLLVLSRYEVPHDEGTLEKSGHVEAENMSHLVVYNAVYAAYQHEGGDGRRKIKHWNAGRKGKYLEQPLTNNISKWQEIAQRVMANFIRSGNL